jgi:hypothetical protein
MLYMQAADALFAGIACILCGSYAAASVDFLATARNILTARNVTKKWLCAAFCVAILTIGIAINNKGAIGYLTIAASLEYTIVTATTKNITTTRLALMANVTCWLIHDVYMALIPGACIDLAVLSVTTVKLVRELAARRAEASEPGEVCQHECTQPESR